MMDALAIEAAEAAVHCGYPDGAGAVLIVELDGPRAEVAAAVRRGRAALPRRTARSRSGSPPTTPSGRCSGRAASPRSPRSAGSAPTTSCRTASSRAPRCPRCCAGIAELSGDAGVRVANVFHAGDGNLHPLVLFDDAVRGREPSAAEEVVRRDPRPLHRARRLDHRRARRRAWTRRSTCRACSPTTTSTPCSWCAARSTRPRSANPGKVFPTPRLCGEVPGRHKGAHPLQRGRPRGGVLTWPLTACCEPRRPPRRRARRGDDDAVDGVPARLRRAPGVTEEVAEVLRAAAAHDLTRGRRAARHQARLGRCRPSSVDLLLDTGGMDRVRRARRRRPDRRRPGRHAAGRPAGDAGRGRASGWRSTRRCPGATVGGTLATNASGPRRLLLRHASRDLLIGITVVRADGVVAKAGGKVVKNVAGYDLGKLLTGSLRHAGRHHRGRVPAAPAARRRSAWVTVAVADADARARARAAVVHVAGGADRGRARPARRRARARRRAARGRRGRRRRPRRRGARRCSATAPSDADEPPAWLGARTRGGRAGPA